MRQKNFGPKKLWTFFHETTKTPREVFGSHNGESLSLLLVKVAAAAAAAARWGKRWRQHGSCGGGGSATAQRRQ